LAREENDIGTLAQEKPGIKQFVPENNSTLLVTFQQSTAQFGLSTNEPAQESSHVVNSGLDCCALARRAGLFCFLKFVPKAGKVIFETEG
jgi:hypothetical protein